MLTPRVFIALAAIAGVLHAGLGGAVIGAISAFLLLFAAGHVWTYVNGGFIPSAERRAIAAAFLEKHGNVAGLAYPTLHIKALHRAVERDLESIVAQSIASTRTHKSAYNPRSLRSAVAHLNAKDADQQHQMLLEVLITFVIARWFPSISHLSQQPQHEDDVTPASAPTSLLDGLSPPASLGMYDPEVESVMAMFMLGITAVFADDFGKLENHLKLAEDDTNTPNEIFLPVLCGFVALLVAAIVKTAERGNARGLQQLVAGLDREALRFLGALFDKAMDPRGLDALRHTYSTLGDELRPFVYPADDRLPLNGTLVFEFTHLVVFAAGLWDHLDEIGEPVFRLLNGSIERLYIPMVLSPILPGE